MIFLTWTTIFALSFRMYPHPYSDATLDLADLATHADF